MLETGLANDRTRGSPQRTNKAPFRVRAVATMASEESYLQQPMDALVFLFYLLCHAPLRLSLRAGLIFLRLLVIEWPFYSIVGVALLIKMTSPCTDITTMGKLCASFGGQHESV